MPADTLGGRAAVALCLLSNVILSSAAAPAGAQPSPAVAASIDSLVAELSERN